jgi:protoporphyrinogen oxidase
MKNQRITIIGAGPTGLTLAWLLAKYNSVTVVDKLSNIGGCHAAISTKIDDKIYDFNEHGPRVYSSRSKYFMHWLNDMKLDWNKYFTPYKFQISQIGRPINFTKFEFLSFVKAWFKSNAKNKSVSMKDFMIQNNFTEESKDYIDRLCRLTDGASSANYSVWKFLQLVNQQYLYTLYQPKAPNNQQLFPVIQNKLTSLGVKFILSTEVLSITTNSVSTGKGDIISDQIIFACPPQQLSKILSKSNMLNILPDLTDEYLKTNSYIPYISISFTWDFDVLANTQRVWGFPATEHGLVHIIMSDYWNAKNTVISTAFTIEPLPNQDLAKLALKELRISYPNLPEPKQSIINNDNMTAYIKGVSKNPSALGPKTLLDNIYTIGTHNDVSSYAFTSIDTAVESAYNFIEPNLYLPSMTMNMVIYLLLLLVITIIAILHKKQSISSFIDPA